MNHKHGLLFFLLIILLSLPIAAAEYTDGAILLVLDQEAGRFSLYSFRHQNRQRKPLALFVDQDNRTSFLSLMVNDRIFKLGDSSTFRISLGGNERIPSLVFESSFMQVTQEFFFIRSPDSTETNGVFVRITMENRGDRQISTGARFLLDTNLGEGLTGFSFATDKRSISSETLLTASDADNFWIDRNEIASLSGSLFIGSSEDPDSVHFANWKKLSDVSWKAPYQAGRNFNNPPYSVGDAAICYYFEPRPLNRGEKRIVGFRLLLNSEIGFRPPQAASSGAELVRNLPPQAATGTLNSGQREKDMIALRELMARIDTLIASGKATEEEMATLELALNSLRAKYGNPVNLR